MNWQTIILNVVLPIILAYVTAKFAIKQYPDKEIYERRKETYLELFDTLLYLKASPTNLFNDNEIGTMASLNSLEPKIHLFASSKVVTEFDSLYKQAHDKYKEWKSLFRGEKYNKKLERKWYEGRTDIAFDLKEDFYMQTHKFTEDEISNIIESFVSAMRKELKIQRRIFNSKPNEGERAESGER